MAQPYPSFSGEGSKDGDGGGWTVIFSSDDPSLWGKSVDDARGFSLGKDKIPKDIEFLRISKSETEPVIIGISDDELFTARKPRKKWGWNGGVRSEIGSYYLGIFSGAAISQKGAIPVCNDGGNDHSGYGFGIPLRARLNPVQGYAWAGSAIPKTRFTIEVKSSKLSLEELKNLLE